MRRTERCSVAWPFSSGWTLDAVEAVCADAELRAADVLHRLGALVDSSLIQVRRLDQAGSEPRFEMLPNHS
jgi:hypothetical protein